LSFFAGMRKGEIQGLQWNDIDRDFIHVRRAFSRGVIGPPKSKKSVRAIPLIQPVSGLVMLWRAKNPDGLWVFPNTEGNAWDMADFANKVIKPALREAAIDWKGFHAGRRGLGAKLRAITGDSTAGRDVFGHSTTRVTEQHYEEDRLPEVALVAMKQLEAEAKVRK
jgi:integrase